MEARTEAMMIISMIVMTRDQHKDMKAYRCVSMTASVSGRRAFTTRGPIVMSADVRSTSSAVIA